MSTYDPMLVEFARCEPILTAEERNRILARVTADPQGLRLEALRFWRSVPNPMTRRAVTRSAA